MSLDNDNMDHRLLIYLEERLSKISDSVEIQSKQCDFQDVLMERHKRHQQWNFHNKARDKKRDLGSHIERLKNELNEVESLIRYYKDLS